MSATSASLRTCFRGARIGFVGLALIGVLLTALPWYATWRAAIHHQAPGIELALLAPVMSAFYGLMTMALLASTWVLMRKPAIVRVMPGSVQVLHRAMRVSGLGLWLLAGLPTAAVLLAEAWLGNSQLSVSTALAWGLGVPLGAAALAAALVVLPAPGWMRLVAFVLACLLFGAANLARKLVLLTPDARNAILLAVGLTGLAFAAWAFKRVAATLAGVASPSADGTLRPLWQMPKVREGFSGPLPRDTRWLVTPYRAGLKVRDAAGMLLAVVALLVLLPRFTDWPAPQGLFLLFIVAGTSVPWLVGAWVSPHWILLPRGLSRRNPAWRILVDSLRNCAPRVTAITTILALVSVLGAGLPLVKCLGGLLVCAGFVVLSAGLAVASVPLFRSPQALALGPMLAIVVVGGAYGIAEQRMDEIARGDVLTTLLLLASLALALAGLGVLAVAASGRAWARYDWSRMPAQPPMQGRLMGAQRRGA